MRVTVSLMFISGLQTSPAVGDPSEETFTGPSAAGERFIKERAGMLPPLQFEFKPAARLRAPLVPRLPVLGADVQVNTSATGTTESTTQSETTLAVRGNTICAGYNNSDGTGFSGLARSTNLGSTWTDLGGIGQSGDPVIVVNQGTGTFYYAEIATIGGRPAIGVARSTDDCQTFGAPVNASPAASAIATTTLNDKPWIAVDNTGGAGNGNIYVCWTRFDSAAASELRFSRSTDGGATYVNEQILAPGGTAPFGCSVAVGPNGEVNVTWADRAGATANDIRFRRSVDAGQTFSAAISVSTGNRHPGTDAIVACGAGNNRPTLTGNIRMLHQSWMAADTTGGPFNGHLYVVWATDPVGTPDNSDAMFSRSTDGGQTWSTPVQIGAGGGATDQFEPFVAVGGTGTVTVAWYDRRNDVANNTLIDVYKTFSRDGGATFDPISRVTAVSFPVPPLNPNFDTGVQNCYMGEYIAIASDATNFYYLWGDNRNTVVTTGFPGGRPDPDVFFEAEAIPVCCELPLSDFRDVRRVGDINVGSDLCGTGHQALNFTGGAGPASDTWITVYDPAPNPPPIDFDSVSVRADVLIQTYNNSKGAGPLALFNEAVGKKGLALIISDQGNSDGLVLATVDQAGKRTIVKAIGLDAGIKECAWYRVTMDVVVSGGNVAVTGKVFQHATPGDPDSALGPQVGGTLSFSGARPAGVDATGEVGIVAAATSTNVNSSVTNVVITP
jgi:hypothetical protein